MTDPGVEPTDESEAPEFDPDLLGEDDVLDDDAPPQGASKQVVRKKKRSKSKRGQYSEDFAAAKARPFVESQVRSSLAKTDAAEVMNRWDWDSGDYEVVVKRVQPQSYMGRNTFGFIASFPHALDEKFIQDQFGGGVYDLTIRGPHPKTGATRAFLDGCRMKVAGNPRLSPIEVPRSDGSAVLSNPDESMAPLTKARNDQIERSWRSTGGGGNGRGDAGADSADRELVNIITSQARKDRDDLARMQNKMFEGASSKPADYDLQKEALKMTQVAMDRAVDSERAAGEKFERIIERIGGQDHGVPPEMLGSLTEQHRSELAQMTQAHAQQLASERDRYDRELTTLRERDERELQMTRDNLQGRLDRDSEASKKEVDRIRDDSQRRTEESNKEWERRFEDAVKDRDRRFEESGKEWERRLEDARKDSKQTIDQERERIDRDREAMRLQHQMQVDHMKALHDGQTQQIAATHKSQVSQMTSQHDTALKLADASSQSRIQSLDGELNRARIDLQTTQQKVSEQGDLVEQANKLKDVSQALGGAFGMKPAGMMGMPSAGVSPVAEAPAAPEEKGLLGTLMRLADSRLGENLFDFIKVAAANAAGMGPAPQMLPGQMPQQYPGQPAGPQYPPSQPGYQPPGYTTNQYRPIPDEEEEEYDEVEEPEEDFEGQVEEVDQDEGAAEDEAEVAAGPEVPAEPEIHSEVDSDGVVKASMNYTGGTPIGVQEESASTPKVVKVRPKTRKRPRPRPPQQPQQSGVPQGMTQDQAIEEVRNLVGGIEAAMNDNIPPDQLAATIARVAPADQLIGFARTPTAQLIEQVSELLPGTMLATYNGRMYVTNLQKSILKVLGQPQS